MHIFPSNARLAAARLRSSWWEFQKYEVMTMPVVGGHTQTSVIKQPNTSKALFKSLIITSYHKLNVVVRPNISIWNFEQPDLKNPRAMLPWTVMSPKFPAWGKVVSLPWLIVLHTWSTYTNKMAAFEMAFTGRRQRESSSVLFCFIWNYFTLVCIFCNAIMFSPSVKGAFVRHNHLT